MNPILTQTVTKDGIVYKGEVFDENIFPVSQTPFYTRIKINDEKTNIEYECQVIQEKLTKEILKAQIDLTIERWKNPVKTIEQ